MPSNNPSQRAAEISEELEILRTHSANCSDNAAKILLNVIGQFKVFLKALTMLAGGGERSRMLFLRINWPASTRSIWHARRCPMGAPEKC